MAIAFMGGLFFVTFYLQNVHGMSPIDAGLHLLPLTGMMIVGSPLAGAAITKLGPRIPLAGGMAATAIAMYGMSTLDTDTGSAVMSIWFALLGFGSHRSWSARRRSSSATPRWSCRASRADCSRRPCRSAAASARQCWAR